MTDTEPDQAPILSGAVDANIESVVNLERSFEESKNTTDRIVESIGTFAGSLLFVGLQLTLFALWFLANTGHVPGVRPFDPYPFTLLSLSVAIEAVLLSTFVLLEQNLARRHTQHRDHLNLQIDLLSEKEITKCLQLLQVIAVRLKIDEVGRDPELAEMAESTSVDKLADLIKTELPLE